MLIECPNLSELGGQLLGICWLIPLPVHAAQPACLATPHLHGHCDIAVSTSLPGYCTTGSLLQAYVLQLQHDHQSATYATMCTSAMAP